MTVTEAVDQFLEYLEVERNYSPLTIEVYCRQLRRFLEWLAESEPQVVDVEAIDLELVRRYRLFLARVLLPDGGRLKKITQTYHLIALRGLLRYLTVQRSVQTLAPDRIELPKGNERTIRFLESDDVDRLLDTPNTSKEMGLRDRAVLETLFSTGLRVSELVKLDRAQIDLERRELGVVGKGRKPRVVFLSDDAAEWLAKYLQSRDDNHKPLFIRYSGKEDASKGGENMRLTVRTIQRIVARYAKECRLQVRTSPHTLRHSFATDLLINGADIRSVQEMLGHENITTTQVYTHVTDSHLKEVHRNFHARRKSE